MARNNIKEVTVRNNINRRTTLLRGKLMDTGETFDFPFDADEYEGKINHDQVIEDYRREDIEILDWTSDNYFE